MVPLDIETSTHVFHPHRGPSWPSRPLLVTLITLCWYFEWEGKHGTYPSANQLFICFLIPCWACPIQYKHLGNMDLLSLVPCCVLTAQNTFWNTIDCQQILSYWTDAAAGTQCADIVQSKVTQGQGLTEDSSDSPKCLTKAQWYLHLGGAGGVWCVRDSERERERERDFG